MHLTAAVCISRMTLIKFSSERNWIIYILSSSPLPLSPRASLSLPVTADYLSGCVGEVRWSPSLYPDLYTPTSPSWSLHWTYRDSQLVNLPVSLLVEGDVIVLRPGQEAFASLRGIKVSVCEDTHICVYECTSMSTLILRCRGSQIRYMRKMCRNSLYWIEWVWFLHSYSQAPSSGTMSSNTPLGILSELESTVIAIFSISITPFWIYHLNSTCFLSLNVSWRQPLTDWVEFWLMKHKF